jgi:hypothetical protein
MKAWFPPRRVTSTATTITVSSAQTLLAQAANDPSGWTNGFKPFHGGGLNTTSSWYDSWANSNVLADVTCDGDPIVQPAYHTMLEWCGKGSYDPITKQVIFMGHGTGSGLGLYRYNTLTRYDEQNNLWIARRGWMADGDENGIGHMYDNNCISIPARKAFKKQFHYTEPGDPSGGTGPFHVYNIDSDSFGTPIYGPVEAYGYGYSCADVATTRGTQGRLWYVHTVSGSNGANLSEYDIATGLATSNSNRTAWGSPIVGSASLPGLTFGTEGQNWNIAFNPRAFGGAGGAIINGGASSGASYKGTSYTVRADTLAVAQITWPGATPLDGRQNGHLCREPNGTGWLLFDNTARQVWRCRPGDSSWTMIASSLPTALTTYSAILVIPIDDLGVVWIIRERITTQDPVERAWLYKPA